MCELLAGAMLGGPTNQTTDPPGRGLMNNMLAIFIDPARFGEPSFIRGEVDAILAHVKASPAADPSRPVVVAGGPERAVRAERLVKGIPLDERSWSEILSVAAAVGVSAMPGTVEMTASD